MTLYSPVCVISGYATHSSHLISCSVRVQLKPRSYFKHFEIEIALCSHTEGSTSPTCSPILPIGYNIVQPAKSSLIGVWLHY